MRVVLDTNVLVSALAFPGGPPSRVLELASEEAVEAFVSPTLLRELARVLRDKLGLPDDTVSELTSAAAGICNLVTPRIQVDELRRDPDDNRVLELAAEAEADYIVTGNLRHLRPLAEWRGTKIRTPAEFLEEIGTPVD